jgi:hypothetical protein
MSLDPKRPDVGDLILDATNVAGIIVDVPTDKLSGLLTSQPGCDEVVAEVRSNQPVLGVQAGIRDEDVADINTTVAQMAEIRSLLPASRKLLELLEDTLAVLDDRLQRQVFTIASTVERRAKMLRNDELLARYSRARKYRSATAQKAARTRKRNQAGNQPSSPALPVVIDTPDETSAS